MIRTSPLLTPEQMRKMEEEYLRHSAVPSIELMETAAEEALRVLAEQFPEALGRTVYFACGPGGNGGDGYACARLFARRCGKAVVLSPLGEEAARGDAAMNLARARSAEGVAFAKVEDLPKLPPPAVWVDAMFGIGLKRPVEGDCARVARRIALDRAEGSGVLSIDIPSGIHGGSGRAMGQAVEADATVTFEAAKTGHRLMDGLDATGRLAVRSIGIGPRYLPGDAAGLIESIRLPRRRRNTHKNTFGHLLIVAGSLGMAGAACLCARGAMRAGAGMVTVACPRSIAPILQIAAPGALCLPLPETDGRIAEAAVDALRAAFPGKTAVACGPGLRASTPPDVIAAVLDCGLPAALDADALNIIAGRDDLRGRLRAHHVVTPHPGEAARLLGRRCEDPVEDAMALRALGPVAVLKGASSVVAGNRIAVSAAGSCGMARGGSGDILTGLVGAMLVSMPGDPEAAACCAVHLHGKAGEAAAARFGIYAMQAEDILGALPEAFASCGTL